MASSVLNKTLGFLNHFLQSKNITFSNLFYLEGTMFFFKMKYRHLLALICAFKTK